MQISYFVFSKYNIKFLIDLTDSFLHLLTACTLFSKFIKYDPIIVSKNLYTNNIFNSLIGLDNFYKYRFCNRISDNSSCSHGTSFSSIKNNLNHYYYQSITSICNAETMVPLLLWLDFWHSIIFYSNSVCAIIPNHMDWTFPFYLVITLSTPKYQRILQSTFSKLWALFWPII